MSVPFHPTGGWEQVPPENVITEAPLPEMTQAEAQKRVDDLRPGTGKRYTKLRGLYGTIGILTMGFDPVCGTGILQGAEETARAVDRLCQQDATVAKIVDRMLAGSAVMELVSAHAPIFMVILQHHFPGGFRLPWLAPSENGEGVFGDDGQFSPG